MQEEKILEEIDLVKEEIVNLDCGDDYNAGLRDMAMMAKQIIRNHMNDGWIPVEKALPDKEGAYIVTYQRDKKQCEEFDLPKIDVHIDYFRGGIWFNNCFSRDRNIAWRPLPEPYKPKQPETCKYNGGSCCWPIDQCGECPNNQEMKDEERK